MSPQQQLALAKQAVQTALLPDVQANTRAQAQTLEQARNQAAALQAAYGSVADLQKGQAGQIDQLYGGAADRQAAYAKGYSLALQHLQQGAADQGNQLLGQNNSPQHLDPGTGAADVTYFLGGANPASVLNNAGTAFAAAATGLPGATRGMGAQAAQGALAKGNTDVTALRNQLSDINARRPGLLQQALSSEQSNQSNAYAQYIQSQYLNNTLANGIVDRTGIDPTTGKPAVGYTVDPKTGNVIPQSVLTKRTDARNRAVAKRDDSTVTALADGRSWVEKQLKPGTTPEKVADTPIVVGKTPAKKIGSGKDAISVPSKPIYAKKGGGTTTNIAEAATKAVYSQVPVPKPEFQKMLRQLTGQLSVKLRRYGYRPKQIQAFALDILDDYYTMVQDLPPLPPKKRTVKNPSGGTTTTVGP